MYLFSCLGSTLSINFVTYIEIRINKTKTGLKKKGLVRKLTHKKYDFKPFFFSFYRTPKKQPESISVNVRNRIPVVSSKSASLVRKGEVLTVNNSNENKNIAGFQQNNVDQQASQPQACQDI